MNNNEHYKLQYIYLSILNIKLELKIKFEISPSINNESLYF